MTRSARSSFLLRSALTALLALLCACEQKPSLGAGAPATQAAAPAVSAEELAAIAAQRVIDERYPLHGLVTGLQLKVRKEPDPAAIVVGWLRVGSRVRLAPEPRKTPTCASGWYQVASTGWACAGEGIEVGPRPPDSPIAVVPPAREDPLPYTYYLVKDDKVPEYHRLPSRDEQRSAEAFAARYQELAAKDPKKAERLMAGELPNEPRKLDLVRRYIQRGFFVASTGIEVRASRKFVRTVRGSYMKLIGLEPRKASAFHGVVLDDQHTLPLAWAVRSAQSFVPKLREDGVLRFVTDDATRTFERLALVPWLKRERVGGQLFHKLDDGHYLKAWYVALAEKITRPKEIPAGQPWVHVNIEQQTLVAYRGDTPIYATIVSTGLPGHDTPIGLFDIRSKHVSATMSDIGPEVSADLRYSIEDVPWTQYFSGSVALHGAFWHAGFGLPHSHGCVNIAPLDAHWLFDHTWPEIGAGWHGVTTDGTGLTGSKVWITEK